MCLLLWNRSWYASATVMPVCEVEQLVRCTPTGAVLGQGCLCPLLYNDRCMWFDRVENCGGPAVAML